MSAIIKFVAPVELLLQPGDDKKSVVANREIEFCEPIDSLPHSRSFRPRRALSRPLASPMENLSPPDSAKLVEARMAS
jgi:hypothetical protein